MNVRLDAVEKLIIMLSFSLAAISIALRADSLIEWAGVAVVVVTCFRISVKLIEGDSQ